jgi:hypothetical protein
MSIKEPKMFVWKNVLNAKGIVAIHAVDLENAIWKALHDAEKDESGKWDAFFNQIIDLEGFTGNYLPTSFIEIMKRIKKQPEIMDIIT